MKIEWGYVAFLALWYRIFGDHPWIPLVAQAVANAAVPYLLYRLVRLEWDERIAIVSAALVGALTFNNVYVSTQASDAMCTVLFLVAMLAFASGRVRRKASLFAASGVLAGLAAQFRPNFILFPLFVGAAYLASSSLNAATLRRAAVLIVAFVATMTPWVVRNYRLTGLFIPASTHGGAQLWFGSLQVGDYRNSWLYNPRAAFEYPPIEYSSVEEMPPIASGRLDRCDASVTGATLVYWTDTNPHPRHVPVVPDAKGYFEVALERASAPTAFFYYVDVITSGSDNPKHVTTPPEGPAAPRLFVVSRNHLGDLDVSGAALDVFDIVRLLRHLAWNDPLTDRRLDLDGDGVLSEADLDRATALLADIDKPPENVRSVVTDVRRSPDAATMYMTDGSSVTVPRRWTGRITELDVRGTLAQAILSRSRTFASLRSPRRAAVCPTVEQLGINRVLYRQQPHEMRRYLALAIDNIRNAPWSFLDASARRAIGVFVIGGGGDLHTAVQFRGSRVVYAVGQAVSALYFAACLAGLTIAWRRRMPLLALGLPLAYVPLTICFMLVNARYSTSVQPFAFAFVAVAVVAALDRLFPSSNAAIAGGSTAIASGRK